MKLKTKIIWISCIAVLAATVISDVVLWNISRKALTQEAIMNAYQKSYEEYAAIHQYITDSHLRAEDTEMIQYFLKKQKNDYLICSYEQEGSAEGEDRIWCDIYNHTVLSGEELERAASAQGQSYGRMRYLWYEYQGEKLLVFSSYIYGTIKLYWVTDISDVTDRLRSLAFIMLFLTVSLTILVSILLYRIMTKAFRPFEELSAAAQAIAEGDYGKRIIGLSEGENKDEVGMLSDSFNRMAEAVEQHTRILEESEQRKTLFMGNLTHELKTPMTAISGYADTMLMTKLAPEEEEEALSYIYSECGRLERLSRKMMQLLELEQRKDIVMVEGSVGVLFEAAEQACHKKIRDKQITLMIQEHGERLVMDMDLMTDVVINLLDNAIKASEAESEIWLRAGTDEKGHTYLQVEDFGSGIPEEELDKILEPFYMVDKSRSRKNGGAGLGLALVKLILKEHHMQMKFNSAIGVGTMVSITNT